MNNEKQYTLDTKQAAFIMGVTPESFRTLYSGFLDRQKRGVKVYFNQEDIQFAAFNKNLVNKSKFAEYLQTINKTKNV